MLRDLKGDSLMFVNYNWRCPGRECVFIHISFHFCSDVCNLRAALRYGFWRNIKRFHAIISSVCHANCITLGVFFFLCNMFIKITRYIVYILQAYLSSASTHISLRAGWLPKRTFALDSCERFHFTHRTWCIFVVWNEFCCTHFCTTKGASVSYGSCLRVWQTSPSSAVCHSEKSQKWHKKGMVFFFLKKPPHLPALWEAQWIVLHLSCFTANERFLLICGDLAMGLRFALFLLLLPLEARDEFASSISSMNQAASGSKSFLLRRRATDVAAGPLQCLPGWKVPSIISPFVPALLALFVCLFAAAAAARMSRGERVPFRERERFRTLELRHSSVSSVDWEGAIPSASFVYFNTPYFVPVCVCVCGRWFDDRWIWKCIFRNTRCGLGVGKRALEKLFVKLCSVFVYTFCLDSLFARQAPKCVCGSWTVLGGGKVMNVSFSFVFVEGVVCRFLNDHTFHSFCLPAPHFTRLFLDSVSVFGDSAHWNGIVFHSDVLVWFVLNVVQLLTSKKMSVKLA